MPERPLPSPKARLQALLKQESDHLFALNRSDRHWLLPLCAALATGLPILIAVAFGNLGHGLIASLGGLVFLYTPETRLSQRMVQLMACAFGMTACYALGALTHLLTFSLVPVFTTIALLVSLIVRFYRVATPGSLFFVMTVALAAYAPTTPADIPLRVGLVALGSLLACIIAFFYSLWLLPRRPAREAPLPSADFDAVVTDSVIIAGAVGFSLLVAETLQLDRPYWVPVSCLAVIQAATLRGVWNRQLQRILGTALGLLLAWQLLRLPLDPWHIAFTLTALTFVIELLIVRHYALAAIFITPLTILLAEATQLAHGDASAVILARFVDTALGALIGFAGGLVLHSPRWREMLGRGLRVVLRQQGGPEA